MSKIEKQAATGIPLADETHSGYGVVSERVMRSGRAPSMRAPEGESTPWKSFQRGWSEQEKKDELCDWEPERVAQFIQHYAAMLRSMFDNSQDACGKCLTLLSFRMLETGARELEFYASVEGTRFGTLSEDFNCSIRLTPSAAASAPRDSEKNSTEATLSTEIMPALGEKTQPVWNDAQACLTLWAQAQAAFGDSKGTRSAEDAAMLMVHFEHVSEKNAASFNGNLTGLYKEQDGAREDAGLDASIATTRSGLTPRKVNAPRKFRN